MPKQFVDYDNAYSLISGIAEKLVSMLVTANPSTTPSTELEKLQVGNTTYKIQTVIANPATTSIHTTNLRAVKIGDNIYQVNDILLENQTLNFNERIATISNSKIEAKSKCLIFYKDASLAEARRCGIVADTSSGTITFTAKQAPTTSIQCDIVIERTGLTQAN